MAYRRFGEPGAGEVADARALRWIVVDARWWIAVDAEHRWLPGAALPGEPGDAAPTDAEVCASARAALGLDVVVEAPLNDVIEYTDGPDGRSTRTVVAYRVCRATAGALADGFAWWPGSQALRDLARPADQWVVRRALGPC